MSGISPLVGRTPEVQLLAQSVARIVDGEGGIILVGGEAGVGKTTLVNHVLQSYVDKSIVTVSCRCPGPGETRPYGPWREAFLYVQIQSGIDVSPLPVPFGLAPALADPFEVALSLLRWLRHVGQPLILTIDDLQWSDRASIDLLRQLSGRLQGIPLFVIGVYRSEDLPRSSDIRHVFSEMLRTGSHRIVLHEWNRMEVGELIKVTVPHIENLCELADEVYRLTNGLPLFVAEVLEQFKRSNHTSIPVSETVQQAIDGKLNLLNSAYIPVLEEAAQIGEQFSYRLLVRVSESTKEQVTAALHEAKQIGLIWNLDGQPDTFQFRHAIVRSVLMSRMLGFRLERCHELIGSVLEKTVPTATDGIAFHYRQANNPRAVQFLILAGDNALCVGAFLDAEERYQQVLECFPVDESIRAEILLKLGFCLQRRNEANAARYLESALSLAQQCGDLPVFTWVRHLLYERAYVRGDTVILGDILALSRLEEQLLENERYLELEHLLFGDHCEYPRIVMIYWSFLYTHGRLDDAEQVLNRLQVRVGTHNPHVLRMKSRLSAFMGRLDEAIAIVHELSKAMYRQHNDLATTILFTNYVYHTYLYKTDQPQQVDMVIQELLRLEEETNQKNGFGFMPKAYSASGWYHYTRGNWQEARKHLVDYVRAEPEPDPLITWFAAAMLVETADTTHLDAVLAKLTPIRPSDPPPPSTTVFTWVHAIRAQAHLLRGELYQAKAWLDAADAHPLSQVSKIHRPLIDIAWADYYRKTGDVMKALETCERALTWAESVPIPWFIIKARRRLGELKCELARFAEGLKMLEDAASLAKTCKLPYEEALCHLSEGRVWNGAVESTGAVDWDATVVERLQSAREVFARLGAREQADAEQLLEAFKDAEASCVTAPTRQPAGSVLTLREWEVARLVADGLTDKEVAAKLYVSPRTVDHHLRSIFRKLDVRHRTALAAYLNKQEK